jgi:hypothetical protein
MKMQARARKSAGPWHLRGIRCAFAVVALVIAACGGAPEALVIEKPELKASEVPAPTQVHPATELAGLYAYMNSTNQMEYLGLAIPSASSSADAEWFAWHRQTSGGYPWLYHGFFTLSIDGKAQSSSAGVTQAKGNSPPSSVSIALTQAGKNSFTASVIENNVTNPTPSGYTAQSVQTGFVFTASALTTDLSGPWIGTWFDSGSTFANRTLHFSNGMIAGITLNACILDLNLVPAARWNYYDAIATIDPSKYDQPTCNWTRYSQGQVKRLQGIAVIQASVTGHAHLDMMLLDGTGAGISYRGTR